MRPPSTNPNSNPSPSLRSTWRAALTGAALFAVLWAALCVDWHPVFQMMALVRPGPLLACVGVAIVAVGLRALRLALLTEGPSLFPGAWRAFALGYFGSLAMPFGSNELVKVGALSRLTGVNLTRCAAAVLMDRMADLLGMALVLLLLVVQGAAASLRVVPLLVLGGLASTLLILFAALAFRGHHFRERMQRLDPGGHRPGVQRLLARYDDLHAQALRLRRPGLLPSIGGLQLAIVTLDALGVWACLQAFPFGHGLGWMVPFRLNLYLMLAAALPLLPGGLGTHQVACVLALRPSGVGQPQALAISVVAQGTTIAFILAQGLVALVHAPSRILRGGAPPEAGA